MKPYPTEEETVNATLWAASHYLYEPMTRDILLYMEDEDEFMEWVSNHTIEALQDNPPQLVWSMIEDLTGNILRDYTPRQSK